MADTQPTPSTLFKISGNVTSLFQCEKLAGALSVKPALVKKLSKKHGGDHCQMAYCILQNWVKQRERDTTSQALYDTLKRSHIKSLQTLAQRVRFLLLGRGKMSSTNTNSVEVQSEGGAIPT